MVSAAGPLPSGLAPGAAAAVYVAMVAIWTCAAILAFAGSLALPLSEPFLAGLMSMAAIVAYRLVVTDKGERLLRRSFALYLAPQVVDKMLASNKLPVLGGETREVTVFFSDLAGFSSISENMTPEDLVAFMNEYLSAMTDIIESKGGYVDKYIGDSIVAVFGAPAVFVDAQGLRVSRREPGRRCSRGCAQHDGNMMLGSERDSSIKPGKVKAPLRRLKRRPGKLRYAHDLHMRLLHEVEIRLPSRLGPLFRIPRGAEQWCGTGLLPAHTRQGSD